MGPRARPGRPTMAMLGGGADISLIAPPRPIPGLIPGRPVKPPCPIARPTFPPIAPKSGGATGRGGAGAMGSPICFMLPQPDRAGACSIIPMSATPGGAGAGAGGRTPIPGRPNCLIPNGIVVPFCSGSEQVTLLVPLTSFETLDSRPQESV